MYCSGNPVKLIDPNGLDTAFADNQARKDFLSTQSIVNNRISEISNKISNLKNQTSTKKIERQIKGLESLLYGLQKIKDDIDYICSPNTPMVTYSSDISILEDDKAGKTIQTYNKETLEILYANVFIRPGNLSAYIHENRHARQNPLMSLCESEIEAFTYQSVFDTEYVKNQIEIEKSNYYNAHKMDPNLFPEWNIKQMVEHRYKCK